MALPPPQGISKLVGEAWSALPLGERQPYVEAAAADKERFEREMAEHQARHLRVSGALGRWTGWQESRGRARDVAGVRASTAAGTPSGLRADP